MVIYLLGYHARMLLVGQFLAYPSTLEVQVMLSAKTLVNFYLLHGVPTQKLVLYIVSKIYILSEFYLTTLSVTALI
jgi:hypothetical protein